MAEVAYKLTDLLKEGVQRNASDLHLVAGEPPMFRVDGELVADGPRRLTGEETRDLSFSLLSPIQAKRFDAFKELDFAYTLKNIARFRVNLRWQQRQVSFTARIIPTTVPRPEEIGISESIYGLTHMVDGLILVTGHAGSGKSTTLASMVDIINTERASHIITIEDPIEFVHTPKKALIEQREVGVDTRSFANGVKYSLRQDPNVVLVGEMRDLETMQAVLTAAETGHLVLSTLHTRSAAESIERIIDLFPPHHQEQIRTQLSTVLRAVISQVLLPAKRGGRVAAREVLLVNHAVANLIRENEVGQIRSQMQMARREGMQTMDMAIESLRAAGVIDDLVARNRGGKGSELRRFY